MARVGVSKHSNGDTQVSVIVSTPEAGKKLVKVGIS